MSERKSMPVYCTLLEADLRERVAELESTIARKIVEVRELDDGYVVQWVRRKRSFEREYFTN